MSIASEITRLQNIKTDIRTALVGKGVSASSHNMSQFAADIDSIPVSEVLSGTFKFSSESYTVTIPTGKQCHSLAIFPLNNTTTQMCGGLIDTDAYTSGGVRALCYIRARGTYISPYTDNATVQYNASNIVVTMNSSGGSVYAPFGANVNYRWVAF